MIYVVYTRITEKVAKAAQKLESTERARQGVGKEFHLQKQR